jgi:hypothetical protein
LDSQLKSSIFPRDKVEKSDVPSWIFHLGFQDRDSPPFEKALPTLSPTLVVEEETAEAQFRDAFESKVGPGTPRPSGPCPGRTIRTENEGLNTCGSSQLKSPARIRRKQLCPLDPENAREALARTLLLNCLSQFRGDRFPHELDSTGLDQKGVPLPGPPFAVTGAPFLPSKTRSRGIMRTRLFAEKTPAQGKTRFDLIVPHLKNNIPRVKNGTFEASCLFPAEAFFEGERKFRSRTEHELPFASTAGIGFLKKEGLIVDATTDKTLTRKPLPGPLGHDLPELKKKRSKINITFFNAMDQDLLAGLV